MTASPEVLAAARGYLAQERAIVAVRADKKPWGDADDGKNWRRRFTLEEIEARLQSRCVAIGFLGGDLNHGIVPLDFDTPEGEAWWRSSCEAAGIDPDDFPTVITPGKARTDGSRRPGRHRYVTDVRGSLGNSTGRLKELGIDVRGRGHAMLPPSPHPDGGFYAWATNCSLDDFPDGIPPCPDFVYAAIEPTSPPPAASQRARATPGLQNSAYRYCRTALERERERLAKAPAGGRNASLNNAALALGHLAHHGAFSEDEARAALRAASEANGYFGEDGPAAFKATFDSGWRKGTEEPKEIAAAAQPAPPQHAPGTGDEQGENPMPPDPKKFTVAHWLERDLPKPDFLLGDLLTTTSRLLLIGPTGVGKTSLGLAFAFACASGGPFLHWQGRRPAKVLYLDGEMSAPLALDRLRQEVERSGTIPPGLVCINRQDYPGLPPLNSEAGQNFVEWIVEQLGGVDMIQFDNIQALLVGSHKEDETWAPMLPWIRSLTAKRIGQIWQHHTGHDASRGYGDKTREWQFDTVGLMKVPETPTPGRLVDFRLEFSKARERTPANRADFEPVDVWLDEGNHWQSTAAALVPNGRKRTPLPPEILRALDFLKDTLADHGQPLTKAGLPRNIIATKIELWRERLKLRGLYEADNTGRQKFYRAKGRLIAERRITVDGDLVWLAA